MIDPLSREGGSALIALAFVFGISHSPGARSAPVPQLALTVSARTKVPRSIVERLYEGRPQEVIVVFEHRDIQESANRWRRQDGLKREDRWIVERKAERYRALRRRVLSRVMRRGMRLRRGYTHLPMVSLRIDSPSVLEALMLDREVAGVFENEELVPVLNESLPLIDQPSAQFQGKGTTVAVLDTGVDYTRSAFGSCTVPGVPAGCRVPVAIDVAPNDGRLDAVGHGTFVAGIAAAVAPGAQIAALDVFSGSSAFASDIIAAIDWAIANKDVYDIVALNLSLGTSGTGWTSECHDSWATIPFANARNAGIVPVVASGNAGFRDAISSPACAPGAVRVGAVYDADLGGVGWPNCTDFVTAADRVACFSNSASFLTLLAPGSEISAAGFKGSGTSMATPHVAGAVAVLRAAFPGDSVQQTVDRMVSSGVPVTDPKNDITMPRLDLAAAERTGALAKRIEADLTADVVRDKWYKVGLTGNFASEPVILVSLQTFDGGDAAGLRIRNVGTEGFEVVAEEEQSADSEVRHTTEVVGYAAFEPGAITDHKGVVIGEAGTVELRQSSGTEWHTATFSGAYADPVVVMMITTFNGRQPSHIRLRNVAIDSFQWQVEEWDYLDGAHTKEAVSYIVFEQGVHDLADGRVIAVGTVEADHRWLRYSFGAASGLLSTPVILSQSQTRFGRQALVTRQRNADAFGVDVRLQEEEGNDGTHRFERIGIIAIER